MYVELKTGWDSRKAVPESRWDFKCLCKAVREHRMRHPELKLATEPGVVEQEVDSQNAFRCLSIAGGDGFVAGEQHGDWREPYPDREKAWKSIKHIGQPQNSGLIVILPVCDKDARIMLKNLEWISRLGCSKGFDSVLFQDEAMNPISKRQTFDLAAACFGSVELVEYTTPPITHWPCGANWAFQTAALMAIKNLNRAFFWMEADCIPLKRDWLSRWTDEYLNCGRPIMGSIVPIMGHCNGTAVYPHNFAGLSRRAMAARYGAWDTEMMRETISLTHHTPLMCHVWGVENGRAVPFNGEPASFKTQEQVKQWVCPEAVLFHRSKDGTLIDRLNETFK